MEALYRGRSLWTRTDQVNITMETDAMLDSNITESLLNSTEVGWEMMAVNASQQRGGNETELREEEDEEEDRGGGGETGATVPTRIVGGDLERRGGSPWQVRKTFWIKAVIYFPSFDFELC